MSLKVPTFFSEAQCDFPEPQPQNVWRWLLGKLRERPVFSHRICAFKCLVVQLPARHNAMESWWVPELGPENSWHVFGLKHVSHFGQGSLGACFFCIYVFWKKTPYKLQGPTNPTLTYSLIGWRCSSWGIYIRGPSKNNTLSMFSDWEYSTVIVVAKKHQRNYDNSHEFIRIQQYDLLENPLFGSVWFLLLLFEWWVW